MRQSVSGSTFEVSTGPISSETSPSKSSPELRAQIAQLQARNKTLRDALEQARRFVIAHLGQYAEELKPIDAALTEEAQHG